jgi:hypothetical protein
MVPDLVRIMGKTTSILSHNLRIFKQCKTQRIIL